MSSTRPLDLLDLPTLYRYRGEALALDTVRLLTRGNPLGAAGFLSYFNPARHIYAAISENDESLVGGITHINGDNHARLLYLAPTTQLTNTGFTPLIEHLVAEAGNWGAFHILAEVDENSDVFQSLRRAGFSVYAWQRFWDMSDVTNGEQNGGWVEARSVNLPSIQSLYHQIVPPLIQPVDVMPKHADGFICSDGIRCYVQVFRGAYGIVLNPLIHPEATDANVKLATLLKFIPDRRNRPVYLCVRSYQAWLEPVLEDMGARSSERQAVMVKHLTRAIKEEQLVKATQPASAVPASRISRAQVKREE